MVPIKHEEAADWTNNDVCLIFLEKFDSISVFIIKAALMQSEIKRFLLPYILSGLANIAKDSPPL